MELKKRQSARAKTVTPTRPVPMSPRKFPPLAVAHRRQTPEEQRQFIAALDIFLAELVRLHLARTERP